MPALSAYAQKAVLDWLLGGDTPTQPSARWLGLSYGAPSSTNGSEIATASRATVNVAAAASPGGSASNAAAVVFAAFSYASTVSGWQLWDASTGGNMLWFGTMAVATRPASASQFTCAAGNAAFTMG